MRGYLGRALDEGNGEYALGDIRKSLLTGANQLWVVMLAGEVVGACVTEIIRYPKRKSCFVRFFSAEDGLRESWLDHLDIIEAWAKERGCDAVEVSGREGWKRVLKDYKLTHVVLRKAL